MAKIDENVLQSLVDSDPSIQKQMLTTAKSKLDYWQGVVSKLSGSEGGKAANAEPGRKGRKSQDTPEVKDNKTHRDAILGVLKSFKEGASSKEIQASLDKRGHPMKPTVFHSTMSYLITQKEVGKKKAVRGKRGNKYSLKAE